MKRDKSKVALVLDRDDKRCQRCGIEDDLIVHHILALADGGADDEENMITLCGDCHRGWHHHVEGWVSFDLFMKETSKVVSTPHSERVRAGLKRTKAKGTRLGRKPVAPAVEAQIRALKGEGNGILKIAKIVGVGTSVVQRVVAQDQKNNDFRQSVSPIMVGGKKQEDNRVRITSG